MKTFIPTFTMVAIALAGCTTLSAQTRATHGRIIEFKSGTVGFDTRTFFYEGRHEVVAFDSQFTPELAKQSIQHLRRLTQKPITWLVLTHPNPDKFNGASVFKREGARIVASQETASAIPEVHAYKAHYFVEIAKMFKKADYPEPIPVDVTFQGQTSLTLRGGEKIHLRSLAQPGVSVSQTVAYIPGVNSLIVGDLIHHKAHAWLEGGIVGGQPRPTVDGWIADLKELAETYPLSATVYGGRGVSSDLKTSATEQIEYLQTARNLIRKTLKTMGPQAKEFAGPNASALYQALSDKFRQAFPGYDLAYMIEYGAYGLVLSELRSLK